MGPRIPTTPVIDLTREQLIEELLWNNGGNGFGICEVGASLMWSMDRPGPDKPDLKSVVAINSPAEKYTNGELRWLVLFSRKVTAKYDTMWKWRRGANMIIIGKSDYPGGPWLRKRLSWTMGSMHSRTLLSALATMLYNRPFLPA